MQIIGLLRGVARVKSGTIKIFVANENRLFLGAYKFSGNNAQRR